MWCWFSAQIWNLFRRPKWQRIIIVDSARNTHLLKSFVVKYLCLILRDMAIFFRMRTWAWVLVASVAKLLEICYNFARFKNTYGRFTHAVTYCLKTKRDCCSSSCTLILIIISCWKIFSPHSASIVFLPKKIHPSLVKKWIL